MWTPPARYTDQRQSISRNFSLKTDVVHYDIKDHNYETILKGFFQFVNKKVKLLDEKNRAQYLVLK